MNHLLCSRCGSAVEHVVGLLGHYQEVHGGVPQAVSFCPDDCNTSATVPGRLSTEQKRKLLRRIRELVELSEAIA